MQLETKCLRLRTPVTMGSRFGDWRVCWLGGWGEGSDVLLRHARSITALYGPGCSAPRKLGFPRTNLLSMQLE
jgi:hypothetical protein